MKSRDIALPIAAAVIILASAAAWIARQTADTRARRESRGISAVILKYLETHDFQWPQPPGTSSLQTAPPDWWTTDKKQLASGEFRISQFDATPNIAFFDARKPWVTYTSWNGRRYELLPDGSISVTEKP